jgi:hypothetical protein
MSTITGAFTSPNGSCKVGWFISGNQDVASSRLQGYLIHQYLLAHGIHSEIIASDFNRHHDGYSAVLMRLASRTIHSGLDVIFFERPNWMMYKLSLWCRLNGIRTIAIRCDDIPGEYDRYFDATIVPTAALGVALKIRRVHVIADMIEVPKDVFKIDYEKGSDPMRVVWVGHGSYRPFISEFIHTLSAMEGIDGKFEFITISKGGWATYPWSLDTVYSHILGCDIGIIPMPEGSRYLAKSANRLTMLMALGMPVIASPILSYQAIAEHGDNCMLATSPENFRDALLSLKKSELRENIGHQARAFAGQNFSLESIGVKWIDALNKVMETTAPIESTGKRDYILARMLSL